MKNRTQLYDVLNNDFCDGTILMTRDEKIKAVQDYFVRNSENGVVNFAFYNKFPLDVALRRGENFKDMIGASNLSVKVDTKDGQICDLKQIIRENADLLEYDFLTKKTFEDNIIHTCIVYNNNEFEEPTAVLGALEISQSRVNDGVEYLSTQIESVLLPEVDYISDTSFEM